MDVDISFRTLFCFSIYSVLIVNIILNKKGLLKTSSGIFFNLLILSAFVFEYINLNALLITYVIGLGSLGTKSNNLYIETLSWIALIIGSLSLSLHLVPGFNNELIFESKGLGSSTLPYKLYANLDKGLAAIFILNAVIGKIGKVSLKSFSRESVLVIMFGSLFLFSTAILLGCNVDIKFGELTLAFAYLNLFVTCVAEESFFRLIIQEKLQNLNSNAFWKWIAAVLTAIVFTLAHYHTGNGAASRMGLVFIAGLVYSVLYLRTRTLIVPIVGHYFINTIHLMFFTYPATFD